MVRGRVGRRGGLAALVLVLAAVALAAPACSGDDDKDDEPLPSVAEARQATQEDPGDAEAWRDLATALQRRGRSGDTTAAISALNRYVGLEPEDTEGLRQLGSLYLAQGIERSRTRKQASRAKASFAQAAAAYRRIIVLEPQLPSVRLELGQASEQAGDTRAAIVAYRAFLRLAPKDPNVPFVRRHIAQLVKELNAAGSG